MKRMRSGERHYGLEQGVVTDINDPEGKARVKVQFAEENVSEWCRVCQSYSGTGSGSFFFPEVGQEVLVAFVHGDMRLPVVLGFLYKGQDRPPERT